MEQKEFEKALDRYVELTARVQSLSSPERKEIEGANEYRKILIDNYTEIGELSVAINALLDHTIYPILNGDEILTSEQVEALFDFSKTLVNTTTLSFPDPMLSYRIAYRLLADAEKKDDVKTTIRALDNVVDCSYVMTVLTLRLAPGTDLGYEYRDKGLEASLRLLEYLDKDIFDSLPDDETKLLVLVNSRYINALDYNGKDISDEANEIMLRRLKASIDLENHPYYTTAAPEFDWGAHKFRACQHMISCTDKNNRRRFSRKDLEYIYNIFVELDQIWHSDEKRYSELCPRSTMDFYSARVTYLSGRIDAEEYKNRLRRIHQSADPLDFGIHGIISNMEALDEYLLVIKEAGLTDADKDYLSIYYRRLTDYLHRLPTIGRLSFATSFMVDIIKDYVDVPGFTFMEFCVNLLVAIHPPTYVHTLTVSSLMTCLTSHLIDKHPELFMEFAGCNEPGKVKDHKDEMLSYARQSSMVHDIGKLFTMEFVMMYGRKLDKEEFRIIKNHPMAGGYALLDHEPSKDFHALAIAHHFRFDELEARASEGLFDVKEIPFIAVAICADAIDAATDKVGRSYKKSLTLDAVINEFREGQGTEYSPYVVELFDDPDIVSDVQRILKEERPENYRIAHRTLLRLPPLESEM